MDRRTGGRPSGASIRTRAAGTLRAGDPRRRHRHRHRRRGRVDPGRPAQQHRGPVSGARHREHLRVSPERRALLRADRARRRAAATAARGRGHADAPRPVDSRGRTGVDCSGRHRHAGHHGPGGRERVGHGADRRRVAELPRRGRRGVPRWPSDCGVRVARLCASRGARRQRRSRPVRSGDLRRPDAAGWRRSLQCRRRAGAAQGHLLRREPQRQRDRDPGDHGAAEVSRREEPGAVHPRAARASASRHARKHARSSG